MARDTGAVCKKCRRFEEKLFLKGSRCFTKCVLDKKEASPKRGGGKFRSKPSEYKMRLLEKQKARAMSGMTETPFRNLFVKAAKTKGKTGEVFLRSLETRLDSIVRRAGFCASLKGARQIVLHGHALVNGKSVNVPSYQIKVGDTVVLKPKTGQEPFIKRGLEDSAKRSLRPSFLEIDEQKFSAKLLRWPDRAEMAYPVKEQSIVEHYSK